MKKKLIILTCVLLIGAILALGGVTLAKYVVAVLDRDGQFTAANFYFRSNVMTEEASPSSVTVYGNETSVTLSNGADKNTPSDIDITYTLKYSVLVDGAWVEASRVENKTFAKNVYSTETIILTPITYNGTVQRDVMLEAISTAPYEKTLRIRVHFEYAPYVLTKSYDSESCVITLALTTNDDGGAYTFTWNSGIAPDGADPNGIFTDASAGATAFTATLSKNSTYYFSFFVTDEALRTAYATASAQATAAVSCTK